MPWCPFLQPDLGEKLPIWTTYHVFLKIRYPKDFKNLYEAYSGEMSQ